MYFSWEILWPIGTLLLGLAVAWGIWRGRRRSRREREITEAATDELFHHPERYDRRTHDQLENEAEEEQRRQRRSG